MKATIIYFSQTGNTRKIAEAMAEEFEAAGYDTICSSIKNIHHEQLTNSDIFGLGTPTFESHAPTNIKNFIKALPMLTGKYAFVFATCGGASGNVLHDLEKLLKQKGSEVVDGFLAFGEVHHPAPCIVGKSHGRPNEEDLSNAKRFAHTLIQRKNSTLAIQYDGLKPRKGFYNLVGLLSSSEKLIRLLEPKPKLDPGKCRQCQRCAHECPMDNITMTPNPTLGSKCIRCYRCVTICENTSFSVNWLFGNIVVLTLWNTYFMHWFGEYDGEK